MSWGSNMRDQGRETEAMAMMRLCDCPRLERGAQAMRRPQKYRIKSINCPIHVDGHLGIAAGSSSAQSPSQCEQSHLARRPPSGDGDSLENCLIIWNRPVAPAVPCRVARKPVAQGPATQTCRQDESTSGGST